MKILHFSIIAILLCVIMFYVNLVSAQPQSNDLGNGSLLSLTTTKNGFSAGDLIDIHGNSPPNYHVELTLIGPNGTIQDSRSTFSDRDGQFSSYLLIPKYAQGGAWKILGKSGTYDAELNFNIFESQPGTTCYGCFLQELNNTKPAVTQINESPLEQFKSGIALKEVKCEHDLQLVIRAEDRSPACVTPDTANILVERGWGIHYGIIPGTSNQEINGTLSGNVVLAGGPHHIGSQANYEVDVYADDGITIVGKTLSDANGNYSIQLPAGNYVIYAPDYPTRQTHLVSVISGKNTILNIIYGTGYK